MKPALTSTIVACMAGVCIGQPYFIDDFSTQKAEWLLAVDGGYLGQPTAQGNLTQSMIDQALSGSYANISGGSLNLKANTAIGRDWGAASAILNVELPENFRLTFSTVKTQFAGHQRFKFIESDPTLPLVYNSVAPVEPKHGRAVSFGVAGFASGGLNFEPTEDAPENLDSPRNSTHNVGHTYQYEIEKVFNRLIVRRDGALQFDYVSDFGLDFMNYFGVVNLQAGSTSSLDSIEIVALQEQPLPGDFNQNGTVDAADYVLWRHNDNKPIRLPNESGLNYGSVDIEDYWFWKANFGNTVGEAAVGSVSVPEPAAIMLALLALLFFSNRKLLNTGSIHRTT